MFDHVHLRVRCARMCARSKERCIPRGMVVLDALCLHPPSCTLRPSPLPPFREHAAPPASTANAAPKAASPCVGFSHFRPLPHCSWLLRPPSRAPHHEASSWSLPLCPLQHPKKVAATHIETLWAILLDGKNTVRVTERCAAQGPALQGMRYVLLQAATRD